MADSKLADLTASGALAGTELFYADSGSADVKVTTQQIVTGVTGSDVMNGSTVTTSQPVLNMTQTWNNAGAAFTAIKLAITNTASTDPSYFMDLGTATTPFFRVSAGNFALLGPASFYNGGKFFLADSAVHTLAQTNGCFFADGGTSLALTVGSLMNIQWNSATNFSTAPTPDLILHRAAAATLQLGAADAAAPVAQTLQVQSVVAGTSNVSGVDWTLQGSRGSGDHAGGDIVLKGAPAGASGTQQNSAVEIIRFLAATGNIKYSNAGNFTANGSVATTMTSLGPTGASTTVKKWLTIVDDTGATGYIPVY